MKKREDVDDARDCCRIPVVRPKTKLEVRAFAADDLREAEESEIQAVLSAEEASKRANTVSPCTVSPPTPMPDPSTVIEMAEVVGELEAEKLETIPATKVSDLVSVDVWNR